MTLKIRVCSKCKRAKDVAQFYEGKSWCKECSRAYQRDRTQALKDKVAALEAMWGAKGCDGCKNSAECSKVMIMGNPPRPVPVLFCSLCLEKPD